MREHHAACDRARCPCHDEIEDVIEQLVFSARRTLDHTTLDAGMRGSLNAIRASLARYDALKRRA